MTADSAGRVAAAARLAAATKARLRRQRIEDEWRAAVRAALDAGMSGPEVAALAGCSRERVYQIRDGRR